MLNFYIIRLIKIMFKMIYLEKKKKIKALYSKNLIKFQKFMSLSFIILLIKIKTL